MLVCIHYIFYPLEEWIVYLWYNWKLKLFVCSSTSQYLRITVICNREKMYLFSCDIRQAVSVYSTQVTLVFQWWSVLYMQNFYLCRILVILCVYCNALPSFMMMIMSSFGIFMASSERNGMCRYEAKYYTSLSNKFIIVRTNACMSATPSITSAPPPPPPPPLSRVY